MFIYRQHFVFLFFVAIVCIIYICEIPHLQLVYSAIRLNTSLYKTTVQHPHQKQNLDHQNQVDHDCYDCRHYHHYAHY